MTHDEACALIQDAVAPGEAWAEFGAGGGTFTRALGQLVGEGGHVWATDRDPAAVRALGSLELPEGVRLEIARLDFTGSFVLPKVDGVLMANALHFASDAEAVLRRVAAMLPPAGKLLLVEYDRERGDPWVPYPVPLRRFRELAEAAGLGRPEEIGRRPSRYQGKMYAAVAGWG